MKGYKILYIDLTFSGLDDDNRQKKPTRVSQLVKESLPAMGNGKVK